jgi:hypothetical protein
MKINEFFNEAYYINMNRRTDRKKIMDKTIQDLGWENFLFRFPAFEVPITSTYEERTGASGLSHQTIIKNAMEKDLDNILIFEDDFYFKEGGMEAVEAALDQLQNFPDWDLLYLGGNLLDPSINLVTDNLFRWNGMYCIHAYAVNKRAYKKCMEFKPGVDVPFDAWIYPHFKNKFCVWPFSVSQFESFSDNVSGHIGIDDILTNSFKRPVNGPPE